MVSTARDAGCFLMPGHILRFETRYALVQEQIAAGELGEIVSITARRNRPKSLAKTYLRTHGILETSIHDLDLLLWYTRDHVKRVYALQRSIGDNPNPDAVWALLEFERGTVAFVETLWLTPDQSGIGANDMLQVTGTRGIANIDFVNSGISLWKQSGYSVPDSSHEPRVRGVMFGALHHELEYFTRCVLENQPPDLVSLDDAVHGLEVALALITSAEKSKAILL